MLRFASMIGLLMAIGCSSKDDGAGDTGSTVAATPQMCGTPKPLQTLTRSTLRPRYRRLQVH